jgi:hypothetical protein
MIELNAMLAKMVSYEDLIAAIEKTIINAKKNGINDSTKGQLAAACHLYLTKYAMKDSDVFEFIKEQENNMDLLRSFNNKQ